LFCLEGIQEDIIEELAGELNATLDLQPWDKYHCVAFDEIHIRQNLVFNKRSGEMLGYVHLGTPDEELAAMDRLLAVEVEGNQGEDVPPIANKMLCFMVTGITKVNNVKAVIGCFATRNLSKEMLSSIVWDVIGALELRGLAVLALVCDGAGVNHGFFQMQPPLKPEEIWRKEEPKTESGVVFCTMNIYAHGRPLYLLNDPPHLLKTARNCLYSSGQVTKKRKEKGKDAVRLMMKNGQKIVWDTVVKLYDLNKDDTIRMLYKLNQEAVYLNSYSKMNVSLAARVLSRSMAEVIRNLKWSDCTELGKFCEVMNDLFDMLNGANSYQHIRTRNELFKPYSSLDDDRFQEFEQILGYFDEWVEESKSSAGDKTAQAKRTLSPQTLHGIERTIRGFAGAVCFILKEAEGSSIPPSISAQRFSQDDLEHYFGKVRARFGGNRHPEGHQIVTNLTTTFVQRNLALRGRKKGSTAVNRAVFSEEELSKPLPKRGRKK